MIEKDPTRIGEVRHVLGATVTVALDPDLAGTAPVFRGVLQPVGQIGSLVRIPQGPVDFVATVTLVGIAELSAPLPPTEAVQRDRRWLQVQLLGEIDRGSGSFSRGVSSYILVSTTQSTSRRARSFWRCFRTPTRRVFA